MASGKASSIAVPAPAAEFSSLAIQELSLDGVKRRYIQAVFFWTRCINRTAKICKVDRQTVYAYLPDNYMTREEQA